MDKGVSVHWFKLGVGSHPILCEGHTDIMSWRPGIDVAIHTEAQLLSAAAFAEFRQAVQDRLDRGGARSSVHPVAERRGVRTLPTSSSCGGGTT